MSQNEIQQQQDDNTTKLVLNTFFKVATDEGVSAAGIARYLQDKFGDVWKVNTLTGKAEDALKKSAAMGFLERRGDRYIATLIRERGCCGRQRRRRRVSRRRRRRCGMRGRRRRRRRRRRRSCCCT